MEQLFPAAIVTPKLAISKEWMDSIVRARAMGTAFEEIAKARNEKVSKTWVVLPWLDAINIISWQSMHACSMAGCMGDRAHVLAVGG